MIPFHKNNAPNNIRSVKQHKKQQIQQHKKHKNRPNLHPVKNLIQLIL